MRRHSVQLLPNAIADLRDIYRFVLDRSKNPAVARRFVSRIEMRCSKIGNVPHGGRPRDDLEPDLRTVPFEHSAIIAYKVDRGRVLIVNIFYGRRDFEAFYLDGDINDDPEE